MTLASSERHLVVPSNWGGYTAAHGSSNTTWIQASDGAESWWGDTAHVARFIGYPSRQVLAVLDDDVAVGRAKAALKAIGVDHVDLELFAGPEDAAKFDGTGAGHGLFARLLRAMQFGLMDQLPALAWYEAALRENHRVVAVRTRDRSGTLRVVAALVSAGGHFINRFGRLDTEEFARWRGAEPRVPALMKH